MGTQTLQEPRNKQQQDHIQEQLQDQQVQKENHQCFFYLGDTETGKKLLDIFEGVHYSIFITVITLITLFADDVRVIFFTANQDQSFSVLNIICMVFFFIEMVVFSIFKENYFLGFYFWLDLISTSTMVLDLIWIKQLMNGGGGGIQTAASVAKVARASRASKIGAKATKLIRIIRLIRFLKLYKTASKQLEKQNEKRQKQKKIINQQPINNNVSRNSKLSVGLIEARSANKRWTRIKKQSSCTIIESGKKHQVSLMSLGQRQVVRKAKMNRQDGIIESIKKLEALGRKRHTQNIKQLAGFQSYFKDFQNSGSGKEGQKSSNNIADSSSDIQMPTQTKVGAKVKDEIQKNLIIMILLIIICIPLFNASTWYTNLTSYEKGILELEYAASISPAFYDVQAAGYISYMMGLPSTLIYFQVTVNDTCCTFPDDYPAQKLFYSVSGSAQYRTDDLISYATDAGSTAVFQSSGTSTLTSQMNIGRTLFVCLVLIVSTLLFSRDIEVYALQPLENMFDTVKKIALNPLNAIREIEEKNMCIQTFENQLQEKEEQTQPNMLQNLIVKIGGLLAVGFGQAGTQIISNVIQDPNFVNVIIPGQKVMGIYGFCDIRNFTDATQVLQADVMVFVNQIAQICHRIVNSHCGSPNKNIGDAFLLVWKYKSEDIKFHESQHQTKLLQLVETKRVKQLADLAVLSFVKMIAEIAKSYTLLKYKNNKQLQNRIKNYKGVKMGFGLHIGWSIEGPIGSQFKVDASYLSPSVNMASRLEAGTKDYGVPMLITQNVYQLMTENKHYLRKIDRVLFDGYDHPTNLYTVDLHVDSLINHVGIKKQPQQTRKQKKYQKIKQNIARNKLLLEIQTKFVTKQMWLDRDIKILRQRYTRGFYDQWEKGFNHYINGEWTEALTIFKRTQIMAPDQTDGPSQTLINFMQKYDGKAPDDWKGFRQATF